MTLKPEAKVNTISNLVFNFKKNLPIRSIQVKKAKKEKLSKVVIKLRFFYATVITICIVLCAVLGIITTYGIIPCSFTKCHRNASICINRPFYAQCVCDWGLAGNGRSYCDECGISYKLPNARIVGGVEAVPHSWPFAVLIKQTVKQKLKYKEKFYIITTSFLCGGTLINHKTVLTAAHCITTKFDYDIGGETVTIDIILNEFYPTVESMFTVYIGMHSNTFDGSNYSRAISVAKIIKHESFDDINVLNDIALLKLDEVIKLNDDVQLACLPPKESNTYPPYTSPAWIVGWGTTSVGKDASNVLRNVKIEVYDPSFCSKVTFNKNWDTQICAGDYAGGKDSCQGDSGGGLFINETINNKQRYVVSGIVSYGDDCALPKLPGIYTRTSYYYDWILKNSEFS